MSIIATMSAGIEAGAVAVSWLLVTVLPFLPDNLPEHPEKIMIVVGFGGQFLFAMRFIIQWIRSEGARKSVIPVVFWYFSIGGGSVLLLYAIWRQDPVIICGQGLGLFIYARNLFFVYREARESAK
ncbi:MAG: lipid-A-disaccharide synthase N-terminal domain-containing protein [Alphaproteobacteria bacterium]|nr:lipid-A-disaccharide synthase N-terminal domain-containing protein [Alphaproteobacteria bacterium]